jgi:hypothetical protein
MSDTSNSGAGGLAKEFLQNPPSNSPPLQLPPDPALLEQVRQAFEAAGHVQPPLDLVMTTAIKLAEFIQSHPYETLGDAMLVLKIGTAALENPELGAPTTTSDSALEVLTEAADGVRDEAAARMADLPFSSETPSVAGDQASVLPQRVGDHYADMIYNPADEQWHLAVADWVPSWLGGGGLVAAIVGLVAAIVASVGIGTSLSQCSLSSPTRSDQTTASGLLRPTPPLTLINSDDARSAQSAASAQVPTDDPLWEAALQRQRMQAKSVAEYNDLVQQHLKIYEDRGVDPCNSGWFPGACSTKSGER